MSSKGAWRKKIEKQNIINEHSFFFSVLEVEGKNLGPDKEPKPELVQHFIA